MQKNKTRVGMHVGKGESYEEEGETGKKGGGKILIRKQLEVESSRGGREQ